VFTAAYLTAECANNVAAFGQQLNVRDHPEQGTVGIAIARLGGCKKQNQ
jgi:hypothetical protein